MTILLLLLLSGVSCSSPQSSPPIEQIELSQGNIWSGLIITVNRNGAGTYELTSEGRKKRTGTFNAAPVRFQQMQEKLALFRREAVPYSTKKVISLLTTPTCPKGPYTNDAGVFWVRWVGRSVDELYFTDLGCDPAHNARRNSTLSQLVSSFPVPRD